MAIVRCDLATIRGRLIAALNAATAGTWATTATDPRRNDTELDKLILAADAQVCKARASTLGDGYRSLFLSDSSDLSHGDTLPDHLGDIEQVRIKLVSTDTDYKAGRFDEGVELADIENWRANPGSIYGTAHDAANSSLSGFYVVQGDQVFFTGYRARCKIANVVRSAACQAPDVDEDTVFGLALGNAVKEGDTGVFMPTAVQDARTQLAAIQGQPIPAPILQATEAMLGR